MADFDIVLYGATGFTGRHVARYLATHLPPGMRWAIAGRNAGKLEELARDLPGVAVVVADSAAAASVDAMVRRTRVVVTTAGPFLKHGTPVVAACVEHGVDYVDITGETPWVRDMIDRHHARAAERGTRIVPFCGFDSVPSDLGTLFVVDHLRRTTGAGTRSVSASFVMRGGMSGGTIDSALTMADAGRDREAADPLLLNPPERRSAEERARSKERRGIAYDPVRQVWLVPFVMGMINTRVVRRSNALFALWERPYGDAFTYGESLEVKGRVQAVLATTTMRVGEAVTNRRWGRALVRRLAPAPGEGPSEESLEHGFMRCRLVGEGEAGNRVLATMASAGDPGYRVTVTFLGESALLLATSERDALPGGAARGGVLTPATALGLPLLERLKEAGVSVSIQEIERSTRA